MGQELLILIALMVVASVVIFITRTGSGGDKSGQWRTSKNGNPTMVLGDTRVTVFPSDGGWKYVVADERLDDDDPEFSDPYETQEQAKYEALAFVRGGPSRYQSMYERKAEAREERRREKWESVIDERELLIGEVRELLARDDLNVTTLRKPEARIASQLKALEWQLPQYQVDGVPDKAIAQAERQRVTLRELAQRIEGRITEIKAKRAAKGRK